MSELEMFQLIMKGLIADLPEDEVKSYRSFYEEIKSKCTESADEDKADPHKLAVIMFAMDLIKDQMDNQEEV